MARKSKYEIEVEKFKKLLGYGYFRSSKGKVEVRVKDLDKGLENAKRTISENKLNLKIGTTIPVLRSFELEELCQ